MLAEKRVTIWAVNTLRFMLDVGNSEQLSVDYLDTLLVVIEHFKK
jgi:hypothetical protein